MADGFALLIKTQDAVAELPKPFKVEAQPTPQISTLPTPGFDLKNMEKIDKPTETKKEE